MPRRRAAPTCPGLARLAMGCGLSEAAATLLRVRVVLMLTYVREPAVMVELAR
mgnify:CR=1 FL=1